MEIKNICLKTINQNGYNDYTLIMCEVEKDGKIITDVTDNLDITNNTLSLSYDSNLNHNDDRFNDDEKEEIKKALENWIKENNNFIKINLDDEYYIIEDGVYSIQEIKENHQVTNIELMFDKYKQEYLEITEAQDGEECTYTALRVYPRFWDSNDADSDDWSEKEIVCCYRD